MALIKCPECGQEISDQATSCPNCGCPMKENEEATEIVELIEEKNIKKQRRQNRVLVIGIIVVAILVAVGITSKISQSAKSDHGLFHYYQWGTPTYELSEKIRKETGETPIVDPKGNIYAASTENFNGIEGVEGMPVYITESGYLTEVKVFLSFDTNQYTNDDVFDKVDKQLTKQYGEGEFYQSGNIQFNFKKDWTTENGFVYLLNYKDGVIMIDYASSAAYYSD